LWPISARAPLFRLPSTFGLPENRARQAQFFALRQESPYGINRQLSGGPAAKAMLQ
jgi:hypothetical protein